MFLLFLIKALVLSILSGQDFPLRPQELYVDQDAVGSNTCIQV